MTICISPSLKHALLTVCMLYLHYTAFHWSMAGGILACTGLVQYKQRSEDKEVQSNAMFYHKSVGLLMGMLILPRVAVRIMSKQPKKVEGSAIEHLGSNLSHYGFYGLLAALPLTGIGMGYYGGKGLPFFFTTIPGADKENKNGKLAGWMWKVHKYAGVAMEYLVPIHIGAVGFHALKGQNILTRMTAGSVPQTLVAAAGTATAAGVAASARPGKLPPFPFQFPPF